MCGISGYIGEDSFNILKINETLNLMKSRGPDNQSFVRLKNFYNIALLHSRLNIIDLNERSNQPMRFNDNIIVFNGEIYNYLELRKRLKNKGHFFKTKSDTEVLLKCYSEFGEKTNLYLEGMWSYAIYDIKKSKLILSRDRFGEKPLFYTRIGNNFFFGSEIKYIKSLSNKNFQPNIDKIINFCSQGYRNLKSDNKTFFKNIFSVNPGTNFIINKKLNYQFKKYWNIKINKSFDSEKKSINKIKKILFKNLEKKFR